MPLSVRRLVGLVVLSIAGCGPDYEKYEAHLVETQAEAGTATIAVTAVEPWADVADELMPAFELTGKEALTKVLPQTQVVLSRVLDSLGAGLEVNLPTSSFTRTERTTESGGQPPTRDVTTEETDTSGAVPTGDLMPAETRKAAELAGVLQAGDLSFKNDPILEYQTALALFQEVKVLNRYLASAALNYCAKPYLVRLQIGVTPYARRQPYDVYTRVSFFAGDATRIASDPAVATDIDASSSRNTSTSECRNRIQGDLPLVIPLLVTDNLELSRGSRVAETLRQLGLGVRGSYSGIGAAAELQRLTDQIEAVAGNSLNSLTSVTRLADNTVQARFGAANDPMVKSYERSMVTRNYNVTLVVLVPEEVAERPMPWLNLLAKTDFRDTSSGLTLPTGRREVAIKRLREVATSYQLGGWRKLSNAELYDQGVQLALDVFQNRADKFCWKYSQASNTPYSARCLHSNPQSTGVGAWADIAPAFWAEMTGITSAFDFNTAYIPIPHAVPMKVPPLQTALLVDDAKLTKVTLRDGTGFKSENVVTTLMLEANVPLPGTATNIYTLAPNNVEAAQGGRSLSVSFPSLAALGFRAGNLRRARLNIDLFEDSRWSSSGQPLPRVKCPEPGSREKKSIEPSQLYGAIERLDGKVEAQCNSWSYSALWRTVMLELDLGFDLTPVGGSSVVAVAGGGTVRLVMAADAGAAGPTAVAVTASGGKITAASPATGLDLVTNTVVMTADPGKRTAVDLTFANLVVGEKLILKAVGKRGGAETGDKTVEIAIVEAKPAPK